MAKNTSLNQRSDLVIKNRLLGLCLVLVFVFGSVTSALAKEAAGKGYIFRKGGIEEELPPVQKETGEPVVDIPEAEAEEPVVDIPEAEAEEPVVDVPEAEAEEPVVDIAEGEGPVLDIPEVEADTLDISDEGEGELGADESEEEAVEEETTPGNVTLVFKDADIRTVLHTLSYKSGMNIVAASDVEGKVTIRLIDVPWETALEVILKNHKLTYEREGNIIRVTTLESVAEEELQSEVFVLNYSNASAVAEVIKEMLTERGAVKHDDRTNSLIVTDIPTNLYKVGVVIKRLDKRTPQVAIEAKIIETTLDRDENLGINWTLQTSASAAKRPTTFPFRKYGSDQDWYPEPEYTVESGTVTSDFAFKGDSVLHPYDPFRFSSFPAVDASYFAFGTLDFSQFSAVLEVLKARTDTKIISNPSITTLDNNEAKITVSTVFNIPTYERNSETGRMDITGYTEKEIGIILTVTPHVNQAGDIVIDLKPEVSSFLQFDQFGSGDNAIFAPRFSTRTAETQVMVKDGQTIAIGGLVKETATKYNKKIPILGDIPILGYLFKKTEDGVDTTDLLIFVTVRLLEEDEDDSVLMEETEDKTLHEEKGVTDLLGFSKKK